MMSDGRRAPAHPRRHSQRFGPSIVNVFGVPPGSVGSMAQGPVKKGSLLIISDVGFSGASCAFVGTPYTGSVCRGFAAWAPVPPRGRPVRWVGFPGFRVACST